jgi:hypothetical protein
VEIYNTKDGTSAGPGAQIPAPVQQLQLSSTSASYIATNTTAGGSTPYTLGQNNPDCSISVTAHSLVDILLVDGQGRECGLIVAPEPWSTKFPAGVTPAQDRASDHNFDLSPRNLPDRSRRYTLLDGARSLQADHCHRR